MSALQLQLALKREIDILAALLGIIVTLPLLLAIAIGIKVSGPGPVFFRQDRVGFGSRIFKLIKFRTMIDGAALLGKGLAVEKEDIRITPFGKFLRKTSLDELPQLFNVLKGDISLVGPRPVLKEHLGYYNDFHHRRHEMKPGITGLATINGRCSIPWSKRIEWDVKYVDTFSLSLDFKILWKTAWLVLQGENTYYDHTDGPAFDLADKDNQPSLQDPDKH
jgi:undecaprenyl phosphate N,N'-diacetylbacillosamine 1-phosphate transferase